MALNKAPVFGGAPQFATAVVTAANTNLDGTTGAYTQLFQASASGCIITALQAFQRGTTAAAISCRIFISYDAGVTKGFYGDQTIPIFTVATGTSVTPVTFVNKLNPDSAIYLPASAIVYVTTAAALAAGISFSAEYRDLAAV